MSTFSKEVSTLHVLDSQTASPFARVLRTALALDMHNLIIEGCNYELEARCSVSADLVSVTVSILTGGVVAGAIQMRCVSREPQFHSLVEMSESEIVKLALTRVTAEKLKVALQFQSEVLNSHRNSELNVVFHAMYPQNYLSEAEPHGANTYEASSSQ